MTFVRAGCCCQSSSESWRLWSCRSGLSSTASSLPEGWNVLGATVFCRLHNCRPLKCRNSLELSTSNCRYTSLIAQPLPDHPTYITYVGQPLRATPFRAAPNSSWGLPGEAKWSLLGQQLFDSLMDSSLEVDIKTSKRADIWKMVSG
jgi:hypothetical protein